MLLVYYQVYMYVHWYIGNVIAIICTSNYWDVAIICTSNYMYQQLLHYYYYYHPPPTYNTRYTSSMRVTRYHFGANQTLLLSVQLPCVGSHKAKPPTSSFCLTSCGLGDWPQKTPLRMLARSIGTYMDLAHGLIVLVELVSEGGDGRRRVGMGGIGVQRVGMGGMRVRPASNSFRVAGS